MGVREETSQPITASSHCVTQRESIPETANLCDDTNGIFITVARSKRSEHPMASEHSSRIHPAFILPEAARRDSRGRTQARSRPGTTVTTVPCGQLADPQHSVKSRPHASRRTGHPTRAVLLVSLISPSQAREAPNRGGVAQDIPIPRSIPCRPRSGQAQTSDCDRISPAGLG